MMEDLLNNFWAKEASLLSHWAEINFHIILFPVASLFFRIT